MIFIFKYLAMITSKYNFLLLFYKTPPSDFNAGSVIGPDWNEKNAQTYYEQNSSWHHWHLSLCSFLAQGSHRTPVVNEVKNEKKNLFLTSVEIKLC